MKTKTTHAHYSTSALTSKPHAVHAGFTLLEMVIVLGIISMIMGGAIFLMRGISDSAALTGVRTDFEHINTALLTYRTSTGGNFPTTQQGLMALVEKPASAPRPRDWGQTLDNLPKDPWGNEYHYKFPGSKDKSRPELICYGKDGVEGTDDDMSSQDPR